MNARTITVLLIAGLALSGCADGPPTQPAAGPSTDASGVETAADDPSILKRPFTAEEIRDEWVTGLVLMMRRSYPENTRIERWTVVNADEEGADIEYVATDDNGNPIEEPRVERSTWVELLEHATFPAAHSTREWVSRTTQLGELEGWLYRVTDPDKATVQEFFFAGSLPGAPVHMRILDGDATVFELEQFARTHPVTD